MTLWQDFGTPYKIWTHKGFCDCKIGEFQDVEGFLRFEFKIAHSRFQSVSHDTNSIGSEWFHCENARVGKHQMIGKKVITCLKWKVRRNDMTKEFFLVVQKNLQSLWSLVLRTKKGKWSLEKKMEKKLPKFLWDIILTIPN